MATNPSYFEIIEVMFENKSFDRIIEFHPSKRSWSRVEELTAREREGTLTEQEHLELELEDYIQFDHIMTLMKARAAQVMSSRAS
jgi:hypothetical protein